MRAIVFFAIVCIGSTVMAEPTFSTFTKDEGLRKEGDLWVTEWIDSPWKELVPSWEGQALDESHLVIEVETGGHVFTMAKWSQDSHRKTRTSIKDQSNAVGTVYTDTLVAKTTGGKFRLRVREVGESAHLSQLYVVFGTDFSTLPSKDLRNLTPLPVPIRAQGSYPGGGVLCSPTSVSMVLAYWAQKLDRPILDQDVPMVQEGVFDPAWGGTGNWSFNTAYAGTQPGLTSFVTRLRGIDDLVAWLERGIPVICSVSYDLLKGKGQKAQNDGHLVVAVGIDGDEVIFNDPGRSVVRLRYKLSDFEMAWASSKHTCYLIYPNSWIPPLLAGPWPQRRSY